MKARGRPILGAISGLVFGLGVGLALVFFRVRVLDAWAWFWLPLLGLAAGIWLGRTAPLGRRRA